MTPFIFYCGRTDLLEQTYKALNDLMPEIAQKAIVIEDPCIHADFPNIKIGKHIKHDRPMGLGFSFYTAYKNFPDDVYFHMEDDWIMNIKIDADKISQLMKEHNFDQIYLSSKYVEAELTDREREGIIDLGDYVLVPRGLRRHMVPNTTPSFMAKGMFEEYVRLMDNPVEGQTLRIFDPKNPFGSVRTPLRAWKVWVQCVIKQERKFATLVGKGNKILTHIGARQKVRVNHSGTTQREIKKKSCFYTVGIGDKYFKLAEGLAESFRINGFNDDFFIFSDRDAESKWAKVINITSSGPKFQEGHLKWNTDKTSKAKLNPVLAKLWVDAFIPINDYGRVTFIDADNVLTMSFKSFWNEVRKSYDIWASRINRDRNVLDCLSYKKKLPGKQYREVTNLIPFVDSANKEMFTTMKGVCTGLWSFRPEYHPTFLEDMRDIYERMQPCTDQECLNYLMTQGLKVKIKKNVFFNDPINAGLIHFTHKKSRAFMLLNFMRQLKNKLVETPPVAP